MNKESVSRLKYDKLKYSMQGWYDKSYELKEKLDKSHETILEIETINEELMGENKKLKENVAELKENIIGIKETATQYHDTETVDDLVEENKKLKRTIKILKKKMKEFEEENRRNIIKSERDAVLKDSRIQQLEELRRQSNERFTEAREDLRWERERRRTGGKD